MFCHSSQVLEFHLSFFYLGSNDNVGYAHMKFNEVIGRMIMIPQLLAGKN
jgi:hypothetical protein